VRYSNNVINNCLVAWAVQDGSIAAERSLKRVVDHYAALYADALIVDSHIEEALGLALLQRPESRLRWPLWSSDGAVATASVSVPIGRGGSAGGGPDAAIELGKRLAGDPDLIAQLVPPVVTAVLSKEHTTLTVLNDVVGVGRLYELRCHWGYVWSNRLGALPIFASEKPAVDEGAWRMFAAAGWFLGTSTPLAGCSKVPPGSRIVASANGPGASVAAKGDDLRGPLVSPRRPRFDFRARHLEEAAGSAAVELTKMASQLGAAWRVPIAVSLTGGRDSRVSAAAVVATGIDATFNTGDQVPGEVDVVRDLIARAPVAMDHTVHGPGAGDDDAVSLEPLLTRAAQIHLVHDGMRNPQEIRRQVKIPHGDSPPPTLSGHGGELGHGFYYGEKKKLKRLERGGDDALRAQLEKNARRKHSAATEESYAAYLAECDATLNAGRSFGLSGPPLLDWFYMAQRLPFRSGLGARSGRWSACVTPSFIRGAFDLTPNERLTARFHRMVIGSLVPEWRDFPFFSDPDGDASMPEIKRDRIWDTEPDASEVEEILAGGKVWTEIFDRDRVLSMWQEVRSGEGSADFEHVFDRVVWREAFELHLANLESSRGQR